MTTIAPSLLGRALGPIAFALLSVYARALPDPRFDGRPNGSEPLAQVTIEPPVAAAADEQVWVTIEAPTKSERSIAVNAGICLEEVMPGKAAGFANAAALSRAKAGGIKILSTITLPQRFGSLDFPEKDAIYHNYQETTAALNEIAAGAPDLVSLFPIGKSVQGREILALRLTRGSSGTAPSKKPGIVFLGAHHAREHLSTEVPLLLAKYLVDNRLQPEIARQLESRDIYFIPMVNPDGAEFDTEGGRYHMHRKNMATNGDGTLGVDLNRNYSWGWGGGGASPNPGDDTYRGPKAFSEPETKAVKAFVEARPNLKILLSYHTFSELILYPWGGSNDEIQDKKALGAFKAMAGEMAKMTGYKPEQSSDLYIATGDTCDWAWGARGIFAFTFELTPKSMWAGGFYPGANAVATTLQNNIRPALYLIDLADDPLRAPKRIPSFVTAPIRQTVGTEVQ